MNGEIIPYASPILNQGVLGALVLIQMVVIYFLFRFLMESKNKRIQDAKEYNERLLEPIKQIAQDSQTQITLIRTLINQLNNKI